MTTTVTWYVDPDATGTGDGTSWTNAFTSLNTAIDTKQKNLVTSDEIYIFECRSSAGTADTVNVTPATTWETDANRYIIFRATDGHQALKTGWSTSRYRLSVTDAPVYTNPDDNIKIIFDGLQMERIYSSVQNEPIITVYIADATSQLYFDSCRIRGNNNTTTGIGINDATAEVYIYNSIIEGTLRYSANVNNGKLYAYNCVFTAGDTAGIIIGASGTLVAKNIAMFDSGDDFSITGSATIDYCASDDGDGTNAKAPSGGDWDNEFNDWTNGDYTLLTTGNLYSGGTDNPGTGLYLVDMEGDSWVSPWSIGVDQPVSAPTGVSPELIILGDGISYFVTMM